MNYYALFYGGQIFWRIFQDLHICKIRVANIIGGQKYGRFFEIRQITSPINKQLHNPDDTVVLEALDIGNRESMHDYITVGRF